MMARPSFRNRPKGRRGGGGETGSGGVHSSQALSKGVGGSG